MGVSNMIGVLEQLNKISLFASEIFSDILVTTEANNKRIKNVKHRLSSIESRLESTESMFTSNSPNYFYDNPFAGKEWQRKDPLRGLLFRRDRATKCVDRRRDEALPLPDLSDLDRISVSGQCVKKYSDSNFFMNEWLEAEKKKMEEEKAKRRERKKKRKKKKRQGAEKITGIERWVYDPITGKKVKKKAAEIAVKKYELTDTSNAGKLEFDSNADPQRPQRKIIGNSKVAQMANQTKKIKATKKMQQKQRKKKVAQMPAVPTEAKQEMQPPPIPGAATVPPPVPSNVPGVGGGPPPVPFAAEKSMEADNGPPPVPFAADNVGGAPPPVPAQNAPPPVPVKQKLTAAEMAARSRMAADESGAYNAAPSTVPEAAMPPKPPANNPRNALMAGIMGGANLRKTTVVKREPRMEKRDMLLMALKKKGQGGLKKVAESEKNVKQEEKVDNTIFAILNRRQFMADDSDSESGSSWSDDD